MEESDIKLFSLLSRPLLDELHFERYAVYMRNMPVLELLRTDRLGKSRWSLMMHRIASKSISRLILAREDILFHRGDLATMLYCNEDGLLKYEHAEEHTLLDTPDWISEPVLWCSWVHMAKMVSVSESHIFSLDGQAATAVLASQPASWEVCHYYAERFVEQLNTQEISALTDLTTKSAHALFTSRTRSRMFVTDSNKQSFFSRICPRLASR